MKVVAVEIQCKDGTVMLAYGAAPVTGDDIDVAAVLCSEPFEVPDSADIPMLDNFMAMNMKPKGGLN